MKVADKCFANVATFKCLENHVASIFKISGALKGIPGLYERVYLGDQIKEDKISWEHCMHRRFEKCIQNFNKKIVKKRGHFRDISVNGRLH
jgi:hypothetical protein